MLPLKTRFMGPTWGPPGADRTQVGPMNFAIWDIHGLAQGCSNSSILPQSCTVLWWCVSMDASQSLTVIFLSWYNCCVYVLNGNIMFLNWIELVWDCSNSSELTMELVQSYTKPLVWYLQTYINSFILNHRHKVHRHKKLTCLLKTLMDKFDIF